MKTFGELWEKIKNYIISWFAKDEKILLDFFAPLLAQVKEQALILGKQDLQAGIAILQNAAMKAVLAAEQAPDGTDKVKAAEEAFIKTTQEQGGVLATQVQGHVEQIGKTVLNNAEAAAVKAAVAIIQNQTTPTANTN